MCMCDSQWLMKNSVSCQHLGVDVVNIVQLCKSRLRSQMCVFVLSILGVCRYVFTSQMSIKQNSDYSVW